MSWAPAEDRRVLGKRLKDAAGINPSQQCWTCHR